MDFEASNPSGQRRGLELLLKAKKNWGNGVLRGGHLFIPSNELW